MTASDATAARVALRELVAALPADGPAAFAPPEPLEMWGEAEDALVEAFHATQAAAREGRPIVYVVRAGDVLGHGEPLAAAVAVGLVSGARAVGVEGVERAGRASVLACDDDADAAQVARGVALLADEAVGPGQVLFAGTAHVGKLVP